MRKVFLTCPTHENCTAQINLVEKSPGNRAPLKAPKWILDWIGEQQLDYSIDSLQHIDSPLEEDPRPDTTARLHDKVDVLAANIRQQFGNLDARIDLSELGLHKKLSDLQLLLLERLSLRWWQWRKKKAWRDRCGVV